MIDFVWFVFFHIMIDFGWFCVFWSQTDFLDWSVLLVLFGLVY